MAGIISGILLLGTARAMVHTCMTGPLAGSLGIAGAAAGFLGFVLLRLSIRVLNAEVREMREESRKRLERITRGR